MAAQVVVLTDQRLEWINGRRRVAVNWTSDTSTGAVSAVLPEIHGFLDMVTTDAGIPAPTAYSLTLVDEANFDVLEGVCSTAGGGADRSDMLTQTAVPKFGQLNTLLGLRKPVWDVLTLKIAGAGTGSGRNGIVILDFSQ